MRFLSLVFIIFIWEKLRSTDAVETGKDMQMLAKALKFGNMVTNIS